MNLEQNKLQNSSIIKKLEEEFSSPVLKREQTIIGKLRKQPIPIHTPPPINIHSIADINLCAIRPYKKRKIVIGEEIKLDSGFKFDLIKEMEVVFVLDVSSSMRGYEKITMDSYNESINYLKLQEGSDATSIKTVMFSDTYRVLDNFTGKLLNISTMKKYHVGGMTSLYGTLVDLIYNVEGKKETMFLVLTDGENTSQLPSDSGIFYRPNPPSDVTADDVMKAHSSRDNIQLYFSNVGDCSQADAIYQASQMGINESYTTGSQQCDTPVAMAKMTRQISMALKRARTVPIVDPHTPTKDDQDRVN